MSHFQIEMNQGRATREEQEFLISPSLGQKFTIRGVAAYAGSTAETSSGPVLQFGRKPFDWMSDSQWQMFLVWFHTDLTGLWDMALNLMCAFDKSLMQMWLLSF